MAVKIRLRRMGQKKAPFYRIVVADSRSKRDGKCIAEIGTYDPKKQPSEVKIDVEKAKQILADAGYADNDGDGVLEKDGKKLSLKLITYQANAALPLVCEALASQLSQIGIAADIEVAEKITVRLADSDWDIGTMAYSTLPTGNPYTYLSAVMGSDGTSNYGHYSNAKVDELLGQLKKTGDEAEQKELVKQIQQIALDDHAYVYMVHTLVNDVTAADVENLAMQGQYDWLNYQMSYK